MASPPSWRMATSKETRVRVEGRSKIIASVLPASGRSLRGGFVFMTRAVSMILRRSADRDFDQVEEVTDRAHRAASSVAAAPVRSH